MLLSPHLRRCNSSPPPRIGSPDGSSDPGEKRLLSAGDVVANLDLDGFHEHGAVVSGDHDSSTCSRHLNGRDDGRGRKKLINDHNFVKTPPRRHDEHDITSDDCDGVDPDESFKSPPRRRQPPPPPSHGAVRDGAVSPPPSGVEDCNEDDDELSDELIVSEDEHEHGTPTSVARLLTTTTSSSSLTSTKSETVSGAALVPPPPLPLPMMTSPSFPEALPFEVDDYEEEEVRALSVPVPAVVGEDGPKSAGPSRPASYSSPGSSSDENDRSGPPVVALRSALRMGGDARYSATSTSSGALTTSTTDRPVTAFRGRRRRGRGPVIVDTSWDFDLDESDGVDTTADTPSAGRKTTSKMETTKVTPLHSCPSPSSPSWHRHRCTPTTERRVRGLWNPHCQCPFSRLNDDVLMHHVFASHLTTTDMLNVHLVCRRWRYVASQPPCRRRLDLTDYVRIRFDLHSSRATAEVDADPVELTSRDVLTHLERNSSDVETLIIKDVGHRLNASVAVEGMGPCLAPLGRLRRVELSGYASLTDSHVGLMLSAPRLLLSHGRGSSVRHAGGGGGGGSAKGLEVLKLEECPLLTYKTACHVSANCASTLRELSLRGNRSVTDEGMASPLADLMRVESVITSGSTGVGNVDAGRDLRQVPRSDGSGRTSSSLPPSSSPSPSSASPVVSRSSSSPSLMDLFSPPSPPRPTPPTAPSLPFTVGGAGESRSMRRNMAPSPFFSPPTHESEGDVGDDESSCAVVVSTDRGRCGGGCLESLDVSRTRITSDGLLRAVELRLSRANATTSTSSAHVHRNRGHRVVRLSEIVACGTGESWTDDRLVSLCQSIDTSTMRVLDLRCSDPFGAERRRRRRTGSTTMTDEGLMRCFSAPSSLSAGRRYPPHIGTGRWSKLERLALSGHGPELTGRGVAAVLGAAPRLSDLDLGGCTGVGRGTGTGTGTKTTAEESIRAFADALKSRRTTYGTVGLRRLNLWRCFPGRGEVERCSAEREVAVAASSRSLFRGGHATVVVPPEERNASETGRSTITEEEVVGSATAMSASSAASATGGGQVISALCDGPTSETLEEVDLDECYFVDRTMVEMLRRRCVGLRSSNGGLRLRGTLHGEEERRRREKKSAAHPAVPRETR